MLTTTPLGISMLAVGTLVGGLFAAFAFAISIFSISMLLDRDVERPIQPAGLAASES